MGNDKITTWGRAARAAFPHTVPVMAGYVCIGIAFGLMLREAGYGVLWAVGMSLLVYTGAGQIMAVPLLAAGAPLGRVALLTAVIDLRHLVYGLSMLDKLQSLPWRRKLYLIFALSDETYALLAGVQPPEGVEAGRFYTAIAALDQCYWVVGSVLGSLCGSLLRLDLTGVDFAMTALFLAILTEQWREKTNRLPALLGLTVTTVSLAVVGAEKMLIPALVAVVALVLALQGRIEPSAGAEKGGGRDGT